MKTTISMSSSSIHASIRPDVKCGSGCPPGTDRTGPQTPRNPLFNFQDTPELISTSSKGNKESILESPVMQGNLPNSRGGADEGSHETFKVLLGGFLISKELFSPALYLGGCVLI